MNEKIVLAIIVAISAMVGSAISGVISPWIKHRLERKVEESTRKREQIQKWRTMILEVAEKYKSNGDLQQALQLHVDYLSLEPLLDEDTKHSVYQRNYIVSAGISLPYVLQKLKLNIAEIERKWHLH